MVAVVKPDKMLYHIAGLSAGTKRPLCGGANVWAVSVPWPSARARYASPNPDAITRTAFLAKIGKNYGPFSPRGHRRNAWEAVTSLAVGARHPHTRSIYAVGGVIYATDGKIAIMATGDGLSSMIIGKDRIPTKETPPASPGLERVLQDARPQDGDTLAAIPVVALRGLLEDSKEETFVIVPRGERIWFIGADTVFAIPATEGVDFHTPWMQRVKSDGSEIPIPQPAATFGANAEVIHKANTPWPAWMTYKIEGLARTDIALQPDGEISPPHFDLHLNGDPVRVMTARSLNMATEGLETAVINIAIPAAPGKPLLLGDNDRLALIMPAQPVLVENSNIERWRTFIS